MPARIATRHNPQDCSGLPGDRVTNVTYTNELEKGLGGRFLGCVGLLVVYSHIGAMDSQFLRWLHFTPNIMAMLAEFLRKTGIYWNTTLHACHA